MQPADADADSVEEEARPRERTDRFERPKRKAPPQQPSPVQLAAPKEFVSKPAHALARRRV